MAADSRTATAHVPSSACHVSDPVPDAAQIDRVAGAAGGGPPSWCR